MTKTLILFTVFCGFGLGTLSANANISRKCSEELSRAAQGLDADADFGKTSTSVAVECQYFQFKDLTETQQKQVRNSLGPNAQITLDTKLSKVTGMLKAQHLVRPKTDSKAGTSTGDLPVYLQFYNEQYCPDYTGTPLVDCEKASPSTIAIECERVLDYSKRCKAAGKCNTLVGATKTCGAGGGSSAGSRKKAQ